MDLTVYYRGNRRGSSCALSTGFYSAARYSTLMKQLKYRAEKRVSSFLPEYTLFSYYSGYYDVYIS